MLWCLAQVCTEILEAEDCSLQLQAFAARVLRLKTQTQLDTLHSAALPELRDKLVQLLAASKAANVLHSLALALAALFVQWNPGQNVFEYLGEPGQFALYGLLGVTFAS